MFVFISAIKDAYTLAVIAIIIAVLALLPLAWKFAMMIKNQCNKHRYKRVPVKQNSINQTIPVLQTDESMADDDSRTANDNNETADHIPTAPPPGDYK